MEWSAPAAEPKDQSGSWLVKDFHFPSANRVEIEWEPKGGDARRRLTGCRLRGAANTAQSLGGARSHICRRRLPLLVEVKNQGRGKSAEGEFKVELQVGEQILPIRPLSALEPGASRRLQWDWKAPERAGRYLLKARLIHPQSPDEQSGSLEVFPAPQASSSSIQNEHLKLEFGRALEGFAYAKVFARQDDSWQPVAVWRPLFRTVAETQAGEKDWEIRPRELQRLNRSPAGQAGTIAFQETSRDADGVVWETTLRVTLEPQEPFARLHYDWKAAQDRKIKALWGPNLYAGDGAIGEAKSWGLFPWSGISLRRRAVLQPRAIFPHRSPTVGHRIRTRSRFRSWR